MGGPSLTRLQRLSVAAAVVDGQLVPGDIVVDEGRVVTVGAEPRGTGLAAPGFVDLQVNGIAGVDFMTASAPDYATAGTALLATGVTAYQPTLVTARPEVTIGALRRLAAARRSATGPRILGAHLEGPFLAAERSGAHPVEHLRTPDLELLERLLSAGPVTTMTVAPELVGALKVVRYLVERGVAVWLGHSDCDAATAHAGFDAGATAVTHLFNAMRPLGARDPGLVGAALTRDDVWVGLIVDGVHLADEAVRLAWRCAPGRCVLVTDAIAPTGTAATEWSFAGGPVRVSEGGARRVDGTLAGSVLTIDRALRRLVDIGVPVADAVNAATRVPARLIDDPGVGVLRPGAPADIVVLDDDLGVSRVLQAGEEVWSGA